MSTRSIIGYKTTTGKIKAVYCHWDGYPQWNGKVLSDNYNSLEKFKQIVALGDLSYLDVSIEKPEGHSFDNRIEGYSVFYGRDRGEDRVAAKTYEDIKHAFKKLDWCEYAYIYDPDVAGCSIRVYNRGYEIYSRYVKEQEENLDGINI